MNLTEAVVEGILHEVRYRAFMKVYFDTNCIIYLLERHPRWGAIVMARIIALHAAGDELVVGDLSRAECLVGPFRRGDAGIAAR